MNASIAGGLLVAVATLLPSQTDDAALSEGRRLERSGHLERAEAVYTEYAQKWASDWRVYMLRGEVRFKRADVAGSVDDFDRVAELRPDVEPELWQRGISQYYAGDFAACARQFETHRTVNAADVENAAWHFLCVAKRDDPTDCPRPAPARRAGCPSGDGRGVPAVPR